MRRDQPDPVLLEFGRRVRRIRLDRGLSQEGLAEAAGIHRTYVGSLERGERNVALLNVLKLASALGVDPAQLVGRLGETPPASERRRGT